jgi:isoamylase
VFSSAAAYNGDVQLCLLDGRGGEERIGMSVENDIWSVTVPGVGPGQRYGYRARGPWAPGRGLFFDARRLLVDPYARALEPIAPRDTHSLVVATGFDWGDDRPPDTPWAQTILYEAHVKGISRRHPGVARDLRGTFLGLSSPAILDHLVRLGVSAVELLPVHQSLTEQRLLDLGLRNYWGYSTLGFFAPHAGYRSGTVPASQVVQFKQMVKALHEAGLEVILDVVYNHTAEGEAGEPPIAFRGLANEKYYRLDPDDPSRYVDSTGTGNTLNVDRREVLRLIMDSLRYWVTDMHVDGFRFDLATTLARDTGSFDRLSAFFDLIYQDPVINRVKLIAEPWDVDRPDSYQVGRFPRGWAEWNDRYRDDVRDFWRRRGGVAALGYRLTGSSDLYAADRRGPATSINYITAHDGKTLRDLVTYERKHNEANGENNHDGINDDRADNFGVEGPTDDEQVLAARARQQRNLLATLLLSQGVPMILAGDECCRTQLGNNNSYCQDNEISWYDWSVKNGQQFTEFTRRLIGLNRAYGTLRRPAFLTGSGDPRDIAWFDAEGLSMAEDTWNDPTNHFLAYLLRGRSAEFPDGDVLVVLNAGPEVSAFVMPGVPGQRFTFLVDTRSGDGRPAAEWSAESRSTLSVPGHTVLVASGPRPGFRPPGPA